MPWKECHVMDERIRFVARLLEGEKMAPLCAEFGISRKTGYKTSAIRIAVWRHSPTGTVGRIARPTDCRRSWKR